MDVALRDAAGGMPKESGYGHFRETEFRSHACKRMPKNMGRNILKLCLGADAIKNSYYTDEVTVAPISRKQERRTLPDRLRFQEIERRLTDDPNLPARFCVRKANAVLLGSHPLSLQSEYLHPPESRQQDCADGGKSGRMFSLSFHDCHGPSKLSEFISGQTPDFLVAGNHADP
jgi:hypothetical protein